MPAEDRRGIDGYVFLAAYIACIPLANWMIGHVGTVCVPQGPCLVPVAPGLMAPSGVLLVGLALVLRDLVQRSLGRTVVVLAIVLGAALSYLVSPAFALASGCAFLVSELADMAVYTPVARRSFAGAVLLSNTVGALIDSAIFLSIAFGSLALIWGQVVGKMEMTVLALAVLALIRPRLEEAPATG